MEGPPGNWRPFFYLRPKWYFGRVRILLLCLLVLVAACHERQRPPAPTSEESNQLNEAEAMLNELGPNEKGPEANATGPSNSSDYGRT